MLPGGFGRGDQQTLRGVAGGFEQIDVLRQIGVAQAGHARLPQAQQFARPAQFQVFLRQGEAVGEFAHRPQALARRRRQRRGEQQHAIRLRRTPPHPPAQLVQLRQPEALGMFDHHQAGVGHVHPHLDDGGGDEQADFARAERLHGGALFLRLHAPVQQADLHRPLTGPRRQRGTEFGVGSHGVLQIERLAFLNERANPIGLPPLRGQRADPGDEFVAPIRADNAGAHRRSARRQNIDGGHVQIAEQRHGQGARNGRGAHHQQMRLQAAALRARAQAVAQGQALRHAEAMLLVHDRQPQAGKTHLRLNDGVGAQHELRLPAGHALQRRLAFFFRLAARKPGNAHA